MIDFNYAPFFLLALLGAIVANSTGAGGGIVFVPAFKMLGVDQAGIVATSFAIQCFGMTAGTLAWYRFSRLQNIDTEPAWLDYFKLIKSFAVPTVVGVIVGQFLLTPDDPQQVVGLFKIFSALFGVAILVTSYQLYRNGVQALNAGEVQALTDSSIFKGACSAIAFIGGAITAWLSIGVGELVAVFLILLRFPVTLSVGVAVSLSALAVWIGIQKYLWLENLINLNILLFAAPAALIGGTLARRVATFFTPLQLKVLIAIWVLFSAVAM